MQRRDKPHIPTRTSAYNQAMDKTTITINGSLFTDFEGFVAAVNDGFFGEVDWAALERELGCPGRLVVAGRTAGRRTPHRLESSRVILSVPWSRGDGQMAGRQYPAMPPGQHHISRGASPSRSARRRADAVRLVGGDSSAATHNSNCSLRESQLHQRTQTTSIRAMGLNQDDQSTVLGCLAFICLSARGILTA